ncbi:MAG TPA: hypothetical protein VH744_06085, partial [Terriglobales bacterium]
MESPAGVACHTRRVSADLRKVGCLGFVILLLNLSACTIAPLPPASTNPAPAAKAAQFIYPDGKSPANPFTKFRWTSFPGAVGYYLKVGTALGQADVMAVGEMPPNITSWAIGNLLPGPTYYARLITNTGGVFTYVDIAFHTIETSPPISRNSLLATVNQLTANVRLSAGQFSNLPTPGTPLAAEVALRGRTRADCTDYAYTLVDLLQQHHVYSRDVKLSLVGNHWVGHTPVEYYDPYSRTWSVADPTFGV